MAAPALVYPIVRFGKGMRRTSHRSQERLADLTSLLAEAVRGHRVVKAFGMERFEFDRFRRATRRHLRINLWAQMLANLSSPVVESLAVVGSAALLVYAGRAIRAGELTAPALISFLANLLLMYDPVRKLNKVNLVLQQALAAAQRVQRIMAVPNEIAERPGALAVTDVEREIGLRRGGLRLRPPTGAPRHRPRPSAAARSSPWSGLRGPASRRWSTCCRASSIPTRGG